MAESSKKLHVVKNGVDTAVTLYDTVANAGGTAPLAVFDGTAVRYPCCSAKGGSDSGLRVVKNGQTFTVYNRWATYPITINQTSNQQITVYCTHNGVRTAYTSTFTAWHGDTLSATVTSTNGAYNAGSVTGLTATVTGSQTISATSASLKSYWITINQTANQTITVRTNRGTYTSSFTAYHGDTLNASVTPNGGWNAGSVTGAFSPVTGAQTISATAATAANVTISGSVTVSAAVSYVPRIVKLNADVPWRGTKILSVSNWGGSSNTLYLFLEKADNLTNRSAITITVNGTPINMTIAKGAGAYSASSTVMNGLSEGDWVTVVIPA